MFEKGVSEMQQRRLWVRVALIGLCAGLIGGGVAFGVGNAIENHVNNTATSVPAGSNKEGGTSVHQNKAQLKNQSTAAYNSVKGAVVSVINKQSVSNTPTDNDLFGSLFGSGNGNPQGGDNSNGQNNSDNNNGGGNSKLQTVSEGSGVIYKKSGNAAYVVTNNHVVSGSKALQVILSNGQKATASIVGTDSATDLAVLKINSAHVKTVAQFGNSNDITAGQDVLAIGSPMGSEYANTVTKGIISAPKRTIKSTGSQGGATNVTSVIQTDAAINSGNSGGPLINLSGQVIGINSMKLASDGEGTSVEGMGFSIPSNEVVKIINQLIAHGKVSRPALGLSMIDLNQVVSSQRQSVLKLPGSVKKGVVVMGVENGSAADNAGLKKYDVVVGLDNSKIDSTAELKTALYKYKVGDTVKIKYYRNGHVKTANVKLSQQQSSSQSSSNNGQ